LLNQRVCIFGEVLFDHFPDGTRVLGGAPFNVAWHLQALGRAPHFISRVGDDAEGQAVRAAMLDWGMDCEGLQTDALYPTGSVSVTFDGGEPHYDIVEPCAYDAIEFCADDAADCRLLYHGTLALRNRSSRQTVARLRRSGAEKIFVDVNLRPPWWRREEVLDIVQHADWVKLNEEEMGCLWPTAQSVDTIVTRHGLEGLVLTRGTEGAEVCTAGRRHLQVRPQPGGDVVDTVGAGDAFAAVMILGLLEHWDIGTSLQRAQQFASALVGQRGATVSDAGFYRPFIEHWHL
jgi:fructokinase